MATNLKKIYTHYENEAKNKSSSSKSTMQDQFIRQLEVEKISQLLKEILKNNSEKIVEIGCGNGHTIHKLSKKIKVEFVGFDVNKKMIEIATSKKNKNTSFKVDDIVNTKIPKNSVDIVFTERCLINLTNWKTQKKALKNIFSILRPKGKFIMLEAFDDGLMDLNKARKSLNLEKINKTRDDVFKELKEAKIGVNVHYMPIYLHPYYQNLGYKKGLCPNSESVYESIITLPCYPLLKKEELKYVCEKITEIVK